jgi:transcriptional regulator with XRE-family HTH domain
MSVHEKIRFVRQAKGLSQHEMAEKLGICLNSYGSLERGETDIKWARLEQIAEVFDMSLPQLVGLDEKNVFNSTSTNGISTLGIIHGGTYHNQNYCTISPYPEELLQLKTELEKQALINTQKDKEITLQQEKISDLNRIIQLLENPHVVCNI